MSKSVPPDDSRAVVDAAAAEARRKHHRSRRDGKKGGTTAAAAADAQNTTGSTGTSDGGNPFDLFALVHRLLNRRAPDSDDYTSTSGFSSGDELLPLEVARFIATGSGAKWLSGTVKEWGDVIGGARDALEDTIEGTRATISRAPQHLNAYVVSEYKRLLRSEMGRRIIQRSHAAEEAFADPLAVPLYVVEDIVRLRLRDVLSKNWRKVAWRLASRASLACAGVFALKAAAKRLVRRRPRARRAVDFVCDVLLPTGFFGPLIAVLHVVVRGIDEIVDRGGGGGSNSGGNSSSSGGAPKSAAGAAASAAVSVAAAL